MLAGVTFGVLQIYWHDTCHRVEKLFLAQGFAPSTFQSSLLQARNHIVISIFIFCCIYLISVITTEVGTLQKKT